MYSIYFVIPMVLLTYSEALMKCTDSDESSKMKLCYITDTYENHPDFTTERPNILVQKLSRLEFSEIDEDKSTLNLDFQLQLEWNDTRISVTNSSQNELKWKQVSESEGKDIFFPKVSFINAKENIEGNGFGPPSLWSYYWFKKPHHLEYRQKVRLTLSCSFDFTTFPFDVHECDLQFGSTAFASRAIKYLPTEIMIDNLTTQFGMDSLMIEQDALPFDISIEGIEPSSINVDGWVYPYTGARIQLKRNTIGILIGGFYVPTLILATLSLLSFMIESSVVPGRLGLLITLTLITMNIYNSVNAPSTRSFSYIEVWIIGIQAPIFVAIAEYGIILGLSKFKVKKSIGSVENTGSAWALSQTKKKKWLERNLDLWTFSVLSVYIIIFNILYWFTL